MTGTVRTSGATPSRLISVLVAAVVFVPAAVGCGESGNAAAPAASRQGSTPVVYFLVADGSRPTAVARPSARGPRAALAALLAGPTQAERDRGIHSAIPSDAALVGLTINSRVATVDLAPLPAPGVVGLQPERIIAQVVRTLAGAGIGRVVFEQRGRPWGLPAMDGGLITSFTNAALRGWGVVCNGKAGAEAVPEDCFAPFPSRG